MDKPRDPLAELEEAYKSYMSLEKSRKRKMDKAQEGNDDLPAEPDELEKSESEEEKERDNREEMDKSKRGRDEQEEIDDEDEDEDEEDLAKCRGCGAKVEKSQKFCHNCGKKLRKSKDSATRAIRESQDSYIKDDDDDIHGEEEDIPEEQGDGDDETIITNMGRRVRPGVKKSLREDFYGNLIKSTGFDAEFFDANPAVEQMADVVGDYLEASERRVSALEKSLKKTQEMLQKSLSAQAALLRANTTMQRQLDALASQPADFPATGHLSPEAHVEHMAKSQAKKQENAPKLSKSMVREKLTKAMVNDIVDPRMLADFDNYMAKGLTADQWVEDALSPEQRQALGL